MRNLTHLEQYRLREKEKQIYGCRGDDYNGMFKVFVKGKSFVAIASNRCGWEHVSISPATDRKNGTPTWSEMCAIKDMFFEKEETVLQYHPAESEYVDLCTNCLHLWRPIGQDVPKPPLYMV